MGSGWPKLTRVVEFHLLSSLLDAHPIVVKRGCHAIYRLCHTQYLILVPELLSKNPSLEEILWSFCRFQDEKHRLTLRDNPYFYAELPTSPEAYGGGVKFDPTEDFQHSNKFYVLTDKPEPVHIMTDRASQSFVNFWCPKNAVIFKGLSVLFYIFPFFS